MAAEVGQQNTTLPGDACDVTLIQDEDLLRKMWQTTDDFGRKKEIRARMYKLREQRLREFYTTGEVLKDVQSVDPAVSVSIREETPKRGGTHYRQLVVGELRGDVETSATCTSHYETTSSSSTSTGSSTVTKHRSEEMAKLNNNGQEIISTSQASESKSSVSSRLPRLNVSSTTRQTQISSSTSGGAETTQKINTQENASSNNESRITAERQTSNTDTKIMSELQKLDTFLSTTGVETPTPTPDSIRSSAFDPNNWTVVSSNTNKEASKAIKENNATVQEFVFESGEGDEPRSKTVIAEYHQPGSESNPEVHAVMKQTASHAKYSSEDGQTSVTRSSKTTSSYSVSHQQRRISTDNSLAHENFARSLRSPERRMYDSSTSTRTSSKSSLDASVGRGSPERNVSTRSPTRSPRPSATEQRNSARSSPRASPEKDRSSPSSPTRFNRGSPTRASPDKSRASPTKDTVDKGSPTRSSPERSSKFNRSSPEKQTPCSSPSPTRDVSERRVYQSSSTVTSSSTQRFTSQTSPQRSSPTRDLPQRRTSQTSPQRSSPTRDSPQRRTSQTSPQRSSPTRDSPQRRTSQTSPHPASPTRESTQRRTSQTSPHPASPTRDSPQRRTSQQTSPKKEEPQRRVSQTNRSNTNNETQRRNSQTRPEISSPTRASPEKDRASSPEKSTSPTRITSTSTTRLTSNTVSKRKLSSASSRAGAKRAGTPGASPNASPTRVDKREKTEKSSSEDETTEELDDEKLTSENVSVFADDDSTQKSELLSQTSLSSVSKETNETLSSTLKTTSLNEISNTTTTEIEISGSNTLPRKKSSIKDSTSPQVTPQSSPEIIKKTSDIEVSGTGTLPRKKSSLKSPAAPKTSPQSSPDTKPESPSSFKDTLNNFKIKAAHSAPLSPVDKPRSILRQHDSPKPSAPVNATPSTPVNAVSPVTSPAPVNGSPAGPTNISPSEPDDSSRSLKNGTVSVVNVSVVEQQLEMTPCEELENVETVPVVSVKPIVKKNTVQERTGRRRSRDYVSDEDTSGRESSSSPVRKHPSRQQPASKLAQKQPTTASPQRPTKLPVASHKHDTGINSPDRCCGRQHGEHEKPWRQSPASSPVSFKRKPQTTVSPMSSPERKPTSTPQRRRPASRSPSTSPDRPHESATRPGRKSPPQKTAQTSPRSPPGKHTMPTASPARRIESPAGRRPVTERTPSGGRLRGAPETQRTTGLAKPSVRGPSSPTKTESPSGRAGKKPESPTKLRNTTSATVDYGDESPPQEFHVDETSEEESVSKRVISCSRIATSTSRRADVVRKVQGTQPAPSPSRIGARSTSQPSRVPTNTTSRVPRVEPVSSQRPGSRVPTATQPQKKLADTSKPRTVRTDSDKSIGNKRTATTTAVKQTVTKTVLKSEPQKTTTTTRRQANNVIQTTSRLTSNTTSASRIQRPQQVTTNRKPGIPSLKVSSSKPIQNGHTPGPVESEDEVESTFSTEEDETVTELEEVRYSSHTVDDTEDEDFKSRVNACGASLKPITTDIVQLRSSRDSSPENRPQRFADHISEPESDLDTRKREPTPLEVIVRSEQITDLDEETDELEPSLLSVADRVSRFLTPATMALLQSEKKKSQMTVEANKTTITTTTLDSPNAVRRARAMFETIANSPSEPAPKQTIPDILSRPSVFDSPTRGRSPVPARSPVPVRENSVKKNIQSFEQETVEENILVSETEEDKFETITKVNQQTDDESKFNTYKKETIKQSDDDTKYNTYKKEPIKPSDDDTKYRTITKEPVKPEESPRKASVCNDEVDESVKITQNKFVSTATLTNSKQEVTRRDSSQKVIETPEKTRAVVTPRHESPGRSRDGVNKRGESKPQPPSGGKFGVTLRKTPSSNRMENKTIEQTKTTTTSTTITEGITIEEITDIKLLEQTLEKATDYDERRRLRAQIREVRRLGPSAVSTPARKTSSPTRQVKPSESERRPSSSSPARATEPSRQSPTRQHPSRQSPTRRSSSPTKPMNEEPTRRTSGASSPVKPMNEEPTRRTSGASSPVKPMNEEPTRRTSGASSPIKPMNEEPTRKTSGATSPTRRAPKDEEDGNRMSSTFIRQASKKFEDESRKSSITTTTKKDESKFATFTRQSSSKKVVNEEEKTKDDSKFNTFTRTSSNKKIEQSASSTRTDEQTENETATRKSSMTIELAKPGSPAGEKSTAAPRKPSVPSAVPGVPREANPGCSVTSSYGVGPTDENGRPLFGLRALRKSQQQEPGSVILDQPVDNTDSTEVKDATGRPLFGLRAIKREGSPRSSDQSPSTPRERSPDHEDETPSTPTEDSSPSGKPHTMPERAPSSGQLRDLVQRHEQNSRGSTGSASSPPQKPRAKLRDSFITQDTRASSISAIKNSKEEALTSRTERSSALRAIIQKHESNTDSEQQNNKLLRKDSGRIEKNQFNSSITVDSVRSSPPRTENEERASPKPADEPTRRHSGSAPPEQVKRPGILKKPRDSPERSTINQSSTTTTTTAVSSATINLRKVDDASVSKIIEDTRKRTSASRSPPDGSTSNSFELESPRAVVEAQQIRSTSSVQLDKCRISPEHNYDEEKIILEDDGAETKIRTTHREEVDGNASKSFTKTTAVTQRSSPRGAEERFSSSSVTTVSQRSSSSRGGTPKSDSPGKDPSSHSIARVGRSGSVKALQQRFQQAAAGSGSPDNKTRGYQKAGLIFRTNSFQHTNGCGPVLAPGNKSKESSPRRDETFDSSEGESSPSNVRRTSNCDVTTGRTSVSMEVNLSGCTSSPSPTSKSFIGNETRVTGVQDILTRMRAADHQEVVAGESEDDREARSLLNKFLGAQVLLQGMEPLVSAQSPGLVSQVERQRLVISTSSSGKEDFTSKSSADEKDLENIWDERQLKQLLDASDDYDSRRKIRARLRVVMAENKVTPGSEVREYESTIVGGGGDAVMSSVRGELLPFIVEQLKTSLERGTPAPGVINQGACGGGGVNGGGVVGGAGASGTGSSISSDDGPAFDSGTESGEDPRTPSSQTEIQMDDNGDGSELSCFMEGLKNSFESRHFYPGEDIPTQSDHVSELPPDVLGEVHAALAKLRGSLQIAAIRGEIVDTHRSEALMSLITRLQTSLQRQEDAPPPPPVPPPWQDETLNPPNVIPPIPAPRKKRQNRHTVGVTGEEIVGARKHFDDHISPSSSPSSPTPSPGLPNMDPPIPATRSAFRPVHFSPMRSPSHSTFFNSSAKPFFQQVQGAKPLPPPRPFPPPAPKVADQDNSNPSQPGVSQFVSIEKQSGTSVNTTENSNELFEVYEPVVALTKPRQRAASWTDDPSHILFTPAQSVQIAIHKAAINKQISQEEENRKNTADNLVLDALNEPAVAISKDEVIHHFPAPVVHNPVSKQPAVTPGIIQTVPQQYPPATPTKVIAPVRPNLPTLNVNLSTSEKESNDKSPHFTKKTVLPQPNVKLVQATVQKVESLKQKPEEEVKKPTGKPLVSMPAVLAPKLVKPILQTNKTNLNSSEYSEIKDSIKKPEIKITPSVPREKESVSFESKPKTKINFNIVQEEKPVLPSVIWGSILNSAHGDDVNDDEDMSSAKKLLQIASNRIDNLSDTSSRSSRSEKRRRLKRANTIDIPKPLHMIDLDDSDDEDFSGDEGDMRDSHSPSVYKNTGKLGGPAPVPFIPKTENDRKFLAFLDRHSPVADTKPTYVASARGGHPWNSRFSNLKTNFENKPDMPISTENVNKEVILPKPTEVALPARKFWSKADDSIPIKTQKTGPRLSKQSSSNLRKMFDERDAQQIKINNLKPKSTVESKAETAVKPPWASDHEPSVVIGSLTVANKVPAHSVLARRRLFSAPTAPPPVSTVTASVSAPKPPQPKHVPKTQESLLKLEELQRQQQQQFMQQKQQQLKYQQQKKMELLQKKQKQQTRVDQKTTQLGNKNEIKGPAPISKFSHAQNSAFRPPEKRSNSIPNAIIPPSLTSVSLVQAAATSQQHAPMLRQHSDEITNKDFKRMQRSNSSPPPSISRQVSNENNGQDLVMMTAVSSRVMAAPMSQQAVVTNKVKRRETDFEAPRMYAAKNLASMLQRFAEADDGDTDPELCMSPPDSDKRRGYNNLVRSAHSTSDMHDVAFQERFSSQNNLSIPSSRSSSIGRYENALSPVSFSNIHNIDNENVITMRLEIPLIQNTTTPSPTQYYQAQFTNPPPLIFSPPTQRRTNSFNTSSQLNGPFNEASRDLSPREVTGFAPLRKCESWHQLANQKPRPQSLALPPTTSPLRKSPSNAKTHLFSKQFEARMSSENIEDKQKQVQAYLLQQESQHVGKTKREIPAYNRQDTLRRYVNDEDLENVDEVFESLFKDSVKSKSSSRGVARPVAAAAQGPSSQQQHYAAPQAHVYPGFTTSVPNMNQSFQRRQLAWEESSGVRTWLAQSVTPPSPVAGKQSESTVISTSDSSSRTEVQTKTSSFSSSMSSSTRVSKAAPPSKLQMSPFAKFKQLDEKNSSPSPSSPKTPGGSSALLFKFTDPGLNRSASNVKERLLYWCQVKTKEYKDLKIENFSTSWSNGMAFCALIHHFGPEAFDYNILNPEKRRKNFELAFKVAEEKFDIAPLLDVEDMVMMKKPDWKCVFTYVQSIYRRFKDELD